MRLCAKRSGQAGNARILELMSFTDDLRTGELLGSSSLKEAFAIRPVVSPAPAENMSPRRHPTLISETARPVAPVEQIVLLRHRGPGHSCLQTRPGPQKQYELRATQFSC